MDTDTPLTHKTKTIGCKVTEEEYDKFVKLADSANLTISEYFRAAIMN
ncbi:plasmid mobilization protein, partial [Photobacterium carnosum]